MDDDSEAEKLSPLLITDERSADLNLRVNSVEESVDDTDDVSDLGTTWNIGTTLKMKKVKVHIPVFFKMLVFETIGYEP